MEKFPNLDPFLSRYEKSHFEQWSAVYALVLARNIMQDEPALEYHSFEKKLTENINEIERVCLQVAREMPPEKRWLLSNVVAAFLYRYHRIDEHMATKMKSLRLTLKTIPEWLQQPIKKIGNYSMRPTLFAGGHGEAILGMEIMHYQKKIGSLGGYMFYRNEKPTFLNLNIQGKPRESEEYQTLNTKLNENWRTYFIKQMKDQISTKGFRFMGSHPFLALAKTLEKAKIKKSYFRMYNQTYRMAGLKPLLRRTRSDKQSWIQPSGTLTTRRKPSRM